MRVIHLSWALLLALPGLAQACCACPPFEPDLTVGPIGASASGGGPGTYYVDNDVCQPECLASVWVYEETNGIPGLQRQDRVVDHTCGGVIPGDTILF